MDFAPVLKRRLIHGVFWIFLIWLLYQVNLGRQNQDVDTAIQLTIYFGLVFIAVFYINYDLLVPRFYFQKQWYVYFILALTMIVIGVWLLHEIQVLFPPKFVDRFPNLPRKPRPGPQIRTWLRITPMIFIVVINWMLSTLLRVSEESRKKEAMMTQLKAEMSEAELRFLKSQINPHFLFNALNNIYSLTVTNSQKAPDMLLKLSDMLRFILYEGSGNLVPLKREISYIRDYIDLQSLKDEEMTNIEFEAPEESDLEISPMILMPFVENAFKHGKVEDVDNGWIKIALSVDGREVMFNVSNSLPKTEHAMDEMGGIGIENVRKRLALLYPDKHDLTIEPLADSFNVELKLTT